jgi:hypothetical protein
VEEETQSPEPAHQPISSPGPLSGGLLYWRATSASAAYALLLLAVLLSLLMVLLL